jgi:hypothetical protein
LAKASDTVVQWDFAFTFYRPVSNDEGIVVNTNVFNNIQQGKRGFPPRHQE